MPPPLFLSSFLHLAMTMSLYDTDSLSPFFTVSYPLKKTNDRMAPLTSSSSTYYFMILSLSPSTETRRIVIYQHSGCFVPLLVGYFL